MINFYSNKKNTLPRFFYRNFLNTVKKDNLSDNDLVKLFDDLLNLANKSDYAKFTWHLPNYYKDFFDNSIIVKLDKLLLTKRIKRSKKISKYVFPHVSDEFSLSKEFLSYSFDKDNFPKFNSKDIFFSIGSCFARNFTDYLKNKNIKASNFPQSEDLNSPGSNSILIEHINKNDEELEKELKEKINLFWKKETSDFKDQLFESKLSNINILKESISKSNKIIITLGNTIDYYSKNSINEEIAPKFIALSLSEEINEKSKSHKIMTDAGAYIRMSNFLETKQYIHNIYRSLRKFSSKIEIIFTVSPVPIDAVIGIKEKLSLNAIEIDCVSKSTLRVALNEFLSSEGSLKDNFLYYLPSYEIVRWIAPLTGIPVFGKEDASSRHVSNIILNAACDFIYSQTDQ
mgnify:FL=1